MPSLIVATYPPLDRLAEPPSGTQGLMQARAVLALALHARGNPGAHTVLAETLAWDRPAGFDEKRRCQTAGSAAVERDPPPRDSGGTAPSNTVDHRHWGDVLKQERGRK
jgi:hypothetical protein